MAILNASHRHHSFRAMQGMNHGQEGLGDVLIPDHLVHLSKVEVVPDPGAMSDTEIDLAAKTAVPRLGANNIIELLLSIRLLESAA